MSGRRNESQVSRARVLTLGLVIGGVMIVYIFSLFSIQIIDGYIYRSRAERVMQRTSVIPAQRGSIFDRNYDEPLAEDVNSFAVTINPTEIQSGQHEAVFSRLADFLGIPLARITDAIPPQSYGVYSQVEVQSGVDLETIVDLAEHIHRYPGVSWRSKPLRAYTDGPLLSHVLGYVGDITPEELQILFNEGYTSGSSIGKSGIERQYDELLRGIDGRRLSTVDAQGRRVEEGEAQLVPPELGRSLVLTIDRDIQELVDKALGPRIGSAVVLKPATGEVLAMVSYPDFDANDFYGARTSNVFRRLSLNPQSPFVNRAMQSSASPASTFKVVMTAAVINERAFDPRREIYAGPYYELGDRRFREWNQFGFGRINLFEALAQSSNVFFVTMGVEHLGVENIARYAEQMGFGRRTGIDLPGEVEGVVPNPSWKERVRSRPWVGGDTANMSIGQGYTQVTTLQLANAVAMVANAGTIYRPHLMSEVRDSVTGEILEENQREVLLESDMHSDTFRQVQEAMRGVITDGTARSVLFTDAVTVAGKTGTGEVAGLEEQWHSWFVAYGPYEPEDPRDQVVVAVMVDAVNDWEWWAPKAANIIFHGIFTDQSYEETVNDFPYWVQSSWGLLPEEPTAESEPAGEEDV